MMKEKNIIFILVSSAIVTIAWISSTIYHTLNTSTLEENITNELQPILPTFNRNAIESILSRKQVPPTYEFSGTSSSSGLQEDEFVFEEEEIPTPSLTPDVTEDNVASEEGSF